MNDFRLAFRQLLKTPVFSLIAVMTLALGIGACTAMFSIVNSVVLKPLPFNQPDRLAWIENDGNGGGMSARTSRVNTLLGWREGNSTFEDIAGYFAFFDYNQATLTGQGEPQRLRGVPVTGNFLDVLGVQPMLGHNFSAEDLDWNDGRITSVILSYQFWKKQFSADKSVIGTTITIDNGPVRINGVLPADFDFDSIFTPESSVQMLTPYPLVDQTNNYGNTLFAIARLKPGVGIAQAGADLKNLSTRLSESDPGGFGASTSLLDDHVRGSFRTAFSILFAAVLCVLLIVCLNLSNLLLARAQSRRKEFAVRVALGASIWRLIRQTLSESTLLGVTGALLGLGLARILIGSLDRFDAFNIPLLNATSVDSRALLFTVAIAGVSALLCGVLPAWSLWRGDVNHALGETGTRGSAGRAAVRLRKSLVVTQIALACVLLIGAGLLIRSFIEVLDIDLGFKPDHVAAWRIDSSQAFESAEQRIGHYERLLARVSEVPGLDSVGLSDTLPLGRNRTWGAAAKGVEYGSGQFPAASPRIVDKGYLEAMHMRLLKGRLFDNRDTRDAPGAVIVNETMARTLWPNQDPIGKIVVPGSRGHDERGFVIGVVADVPRGLEVEPSSEMYLDLRQEDGWGSLEMVVRSKRPLESLVPDIRAALGDFDPTLATGEFTTLNDVVDRAIAPRRLTTSILGAFSALALLLAALGVYGVIAYSVGQRSHEMAIRVAVGGKSGDLFRLIVGEGFRIAIFGLVLGLSISFAGVHLMRSLLFGINAINPAVFAINAAIVLAVAMLASLAPAFRAARTDPASMLR
ncbi:MAG TPA: ABC transporter permease [Dokdonella sp.]|uniref:ABC transporter permease n=1 Tax=Dokdonella sp. TaxID=2291710 RepID=UPI002D7F14E3|nr:ABC transporter permease [Dokdonella sp.]HET9033600.1 ABC transporter permease [Dokdonella sp.]